MVENRKVAEKIRHAFLPERIKERWYSHAIVKLFPWVRFLTAAAKPEMAPVIRRLMNWLYLLHKTNRIGNQWTSWNVGLIR
jgi:hypothetical protein